MPAARKPVVQGSNAVNEIVSRSRLLRFVSFYFAVLSLTL